MLDRNELRRQLACELESLLRGEDPYLKRAGDIWYELHPDSVACMH